jgi:endonuclease/exonuclease/phosphatase family metal-dependent hydrolase
MAIVGRGKLTIGKNLMHDQAWAHLATWEPIGAAVGARPLTLLLGHLPSSLLIARHPRLQEIRSLIEMHHPDLIVGDFNTPRRSWVFAHLPKGYAHAYDVAGSGWSYTWPVPCPLWAIDQCIVGPRVEAIRYELHSKWASDHRLQRLQFRLRDSGNGAEERSP